MTIKDDQHQQVKEVLRSVLCGFFQKRAPKEFYYFALLIIYMMIFFSKINSLKIIIVQPKKPLFSGVRIIILYVNFALKMKHKTQNVCMHDWCTRIPLKCILVNL